MALPVTPPRLNLLLRLLLRPRLRLRLREIVGPDGPVARLR
jgi:hypothetical protein